MTVLQAPAQPWRTPLCPENPEAKVLAGRPRSAPVSIRALAYYSSQSHSLPCGTLVYGSLRFLPPSLAANNCCSLRCPEAG